ncbi:hypothetical protein [Streptomyces sp. NBC_00525]|uniref:hypothetical protein n=1 Tax=Streptomyces sp. NBC_00525 TaxID=2903660 RepID=UPI002E81AB1B|nr:hypothetical protein [Streptomyces sp. NBC_00525]WUC98112.1 hypothetical protein OG710_31080 [Streptomyces sp. NBC_00525]
MQAKTWTPSMSTLLDHDAGHDAEPAPGTGVAAGGERAGGREVGGVVGDTAEPGADVEGAAGLEDGGVGVGEELFPGVAHWTSFLIDHVARRWMGARRSWALRMWWVTVCVGGGGRETHVPGDLLGVETADEAQDDGVELTRGKFGEGRVEADAAVARGDFLAEAADQFVDDGAAQDQPGLGLQIRFGEQGVPAGADLYVGAVDGLFRPVIG